MGGIVCLAKARFRICRLTPVLHLQLKDKDQQIERFVEQVKQLQANLEEERAKPSTGASEETLLVSATNVI